MSKMAELSMEIEELYNQGFNEFTIAAMLSVPVTIVDSVVANFMEVSYNEGTEDNFSEYGGA